MSCKVQQVTQTHFVPQAMPHLKLNQRIPYPGILLAKKMIKMTPHPSDKDYSMLIRVHHKDIDELGHVNNVVYVRWIQEVAVAHWNSLAYAEIKQKVLWVIIRHEVDYLSASLEDDILIATTWVGESSRARSERFVQITNKDSGKMVASSKTIWCMLDSTTLKPRRIDEDIVKILKGL